MKSTQSKTLVYLSVVIAVLAVIASAGGLLLKDLYRDNAFVRTTWLGNDAVTLFLAVPILVGAMLFSRRGSLKAQLIWLGVLDYMLYNFAFYLFGTAFNAFFLIYTTVLGLSSFALIAGVPNLNVKEISQQFNPRTPVRWIGGYFLFLAAGLSVIYVIQSIAFIVTGQLPAIITMTEHPTNVVFALDLTLLIPWLVVGAVWLIKHKPWGYVIASILSVKGPLYTLVLAVNSVLVLNKGLTETSELPLWGTLTVLSLMAGALLFGNIKTTSNESND